MPRCIDWSKNIVELDNFFIRPSTKKMIAAEYSFFEIVQLLFEEFFDITKNKRDI